MNTYNQYWHALMPKVNGDIKPQKIILHCHCWNQGLVKGAKLCFRNPYFYFQHGESTSTASLLTSPASQKSKDLNKILLLLQELGFRQYL